MKIVYYINYKTNMKTNFSLGSECLKWLISSLVDAVKTGDLYPDYAFYRLFTFVFQILWKNIFFFFKCIIWFNCALMGSRARGLPVYSDKAYRTSVQCCFQSWWKVFSQWILWQMCSHLVYSGSFLSNVFIFVTV